MADRSIPPCWYSLASAMFIFAFRNFPGIDWSTTIAWWFCFRFTWHTWIWYFISAQNIQTVTKTTIRLYNTPQCLRNYCYLNCLIKLLQVDNARSPMWHLSTVQYTNKSFRFHRRQCHFTVTWTTTPSISSLLTFLNNLQVQAYLILKLEAKIKQKYFFLLETRFTNIWHEFFLVILRFCSSFWFKEGLLKLKSLSVDSFRFSVLAKVK